MKTTYELPMCYASYELDQVCLGCTTDDHGVLMCTCLQETENYQSSCPFFVPMCVHRKNNDDGFARCDIYPNMNSCDFTDCKYYKPINKGETI